MPTVWIPSMLRDCTNQQQSVPVAGATLNEVIDALDAQFPGIRARLCRADNLRPGLTAVIDGQVVRGGMSEPVRENSEVHFIPAIAGGEW